MATRLFPLGVLLVAGLISACGGGTASVAPPAPATPQVVAATIFNATGVTVYTENKLAWSGDSTRLAFHGAPGGIYEVVASAGAAPQPVVFSPAPDYGMYDPAYVGNTLTVMTSWMNNGTDRNLHVVDALGGDPNSHIRHSFNASLLGYVADTGVTPEQWALRSDGLRAIGRFHSAQNSQGVSYGNGGVFTLDFATTPATVVKLGEYADITDVALSGDGTRMAYVKAATVYYRDWGGQEHAIGPGSEVTLNANGRLVGYLSGSSYALYDVLNGTTKLYALPAGTVAQLAALSPDGTRIAYRIFGSVNGDGLVVGTLSN